MVLLCLGILDTSKLPIVGPGFFLSDENYSEQKSLLVGKLHPSGTQLLGEAYWDEGH